LALNDNEKKSATDILSQAIPSGEKMLSELLGRTTTISVTNVKGIVEQELVGLIKGRCLIAPVEIGDGGGNTILLVAENQAAIMADLMIGQDGTNPPVTLEDLHMSAVAELTNQVIDSVVSNISTQVVRSMMTTPMEISMSVLKPGAIRSVNGNAIAAEADLKIGDFESGKIAFIFSGEIADLLKTGPKAPASAEGFVSDITAGGESKETSPATAQKIQAAELQEERTTPIMDHNLQLILDVPLQVTVELGRTEKLVRDVLDLSPGSVIELDKLAGEPVDILVNQKYIAKGEVVVIDENFGIRITDIIRPVDRIPKL